MTAITWKSAMNGDWSTISDWNPAAVPGAADAVTVGATGAAYTVTVTGPEAAKTLTIDSATATLDITSSLTMGGALSVSAGTLQLDNGSTIHGGTLALGGGALVANGGTLSGVAVQGTLSLQSNNNAFTLTNGTTFSGAGGVGAGTINFAGGGGQNSYPYAQPSPHFFSRDFNAVG